MPLSKDPEGGGTNIDGSKSNEFCSRCYQAGNFTSPTMAVGEMQELVKGRLKQMGFPSPLAWLFSRNIPSLKRWKK
jgi:hypothetical protein